MSKHSVGRLLLLLVAVVAVGDCSVACPTGSTAIPNCATCTTSSYYVVCETCLNGYYLSNSLCKSCALNYANCLYCALDASQSLQCLTCIANFGLLKGQCLSCASVSGCLACSIVQNYLLCNSCLSPLVLTADQTACSSCPIANCTSCSSTASNQFICSSCAQGYYLSANTCLQCASAIQYCTVCQYVSSVLTCSSCASTSLYLSGNKCVANCTTAGYPQCLTCQLTSLAGGVVTCTTCTDGYFLDVGTQLCKGCGQALIGCTSCSVAGSTTSCLSCSGGYFLTGSPASCILCSSVRSNCQLCNSTSCTQCKDYYYLNATDLNCYSCSSSPYMKSSFTVGTCRACAVNTTSETLVCTACAVGYYFLDGICTGCPSSCSACANALNCSSCKSGYLLSGTLCRLCSATYPYCQYCNAVECTDCQVGYYTLDNKNCLVSCQVTNCLTCVSLNNLQCLTCKAGYSLSGSICLMMTCSSPLLFNGASCVCQVGMGLKSGQCQACSDSNCMYCPYGTCTQCYQGYYLNSASCSSCGANCKVCLSPSKCLLCDDGFYFNSTCLPYSATTLPIAGIYLSNTLNRLCSRGCIKCTTSTSCLSCARGYILNGSSCLNCPSNCEACNLTSSLVTQQSLVEGVLKNITTTVYSVACVACGTGAALQSAVCKRCEDALCASCDFNPQFCIQCTVGFTPNTTGSCAPCAAHCDFCDVAGPGTCDQEACSVGFARLNTTVCLPCMKGCPKCQSTIPFLCIGCLIGTFNSSETKLCQNCPVGCATCSNKTTCLSCLDQYQLVASTCQPFCLLPCLTCSWSGGVQVCTSCLRSYVLVSGVCTANTSCTISATCEFCTLGSFAYRGLCYACPSNCSQCTFSPPSPAYDIAASANTYLNYLSCQLCALNFYFNPDSQACLQCPSNCQSCTSALYCLNCTEGYFTQQRHYNYVGLTSNLGVCQKCQSLCRSCALSSNRCTSCYDNYTLSGFRCLGDVKMKFTIQLVTSVGENVTSATAGMKKILDSLYEVLGTQYVNTPDLVVFQSILLGSIDITGAASVQSNDPSSTYNSASAALQSCYNLGGYPVSTHTLEPVGFTPSITSTSSTSSILIIVGAVVASLAVVVIIVCLVRKCRKEEQPSEKNEGETNKEETQNQQASSKGMLKPSEGPSSQSQHQKRREVSHISETQTQKTNSDQNQHSKPPSHALNYTYEPSHNPNSRSKQPYTQNSAFSSKTTKLVPEQQYVPNSHYHSSSKQVPKSPNYEFQIPNESNLTKPMPTNHPQTRRQRKLREAQREKYIPNKNTQYI